MLSFLSSPPDPLAFLRPRARVVVMRSTQATTAAPTATAPPVVAVVDAAQAERDWYFEQLLTECRAGHVRPTRVAWLLAEAGRTSEQLDAALDVAG
ncbi:MAG: hypothetical protein ACKV2Q_16815 [Planctomycetaceae bacterium]